MSQKFDGPRCQSCGIFIMNHHEFGRSATNAIVTDYCRYCYQKGQFVEPDITLEQMIEKLIPAMKTNRNITDEQAKEMAGSLISGLKRWRQKG